MYLPSCTPCRHFSVTIHSTWCDCMHAAPPGRPPPVSFVNFTSFSLSRRYTYGICLLRSPVASLHSLRSWNTRTGSLGSSSSSNPPPTLLSPGFPFGGCLSAIAFGPLLWLYSHHCPFQSDISAFPVDAVISLIDDSAMASASASTSDPWPTSTVSLSFTCAWSPSRRWSPNSSHF